MRLDRLADYLSMWAACRDLVPTLNIGAGTLRKWVTQAQTDERPDLDDQEVATLPELISAQANITHPTR